MADVYKQVNPIKYFEDYISHNIRPDGRNFNTFRAAIVNIGSIKTADSSSLFRIGNTSVMCGIKLELTVPKPELPDSGFVVTNLELPTLCSTKFKPGPPSDTAQACSKLVSDIFTNSKALNLKDLCIVPEKLVWVVYCDLVCINNDGCVVDASLAALGAALKTLKLPLTEFNIDTGECTVNEDQRTPLVLGEIPLAASFGLYNSEVVLADPTFEEEEFCGGCGANYTFAFCDEKLSGTYKLGGSSISIQKQEKAMAVAKERIQLLNKSISMAIQNGKPK